MLYEYKYRMEQNPKKFALAMPTSMVHAIWKDQQTIIKP